MATMVKEKRREKKKSKEKHVSKRSIPTELNVSLQEDVVPASVSNVVQTTLVESDLMKDEALIEVELTVDDESKNDPLSIDVKTQIASDIPLESVSQLLPEQITESFTTYQQQIDLESELKCKSSKVIDENSIGNRYEDLNAKLNRITIPTSTIPLTDEQERSLMSEGAYIKEDLLEEALSVTGTEMEENVENNLDIVHSAGHLEDVTPSAPMFEFEESLLGNQYHEEQRSIPVVPRLVSMPLEEAIKLYGGAEMTEVMEMSKIEEAAVEAGPLSGPEHPLVDLLSTFRRSLSAVERERVQLTVGSTEEEKYRSALWKIEKRQIYHYEKCEPCGSSVLFKGSYEVATLQKEKLPVAKMRLEGLLKDVQDSYCHHQHAALLAHCQIEEFISETVHSNKGEIREALSLILQALKMSDSAPAALSSTLQRWATALAAALLDHRDLRQLLFLIHHLFRQTRSVQWAVRVIELQIVDNVGAARALALLDLLLTRPAIDAAVECTGDKDEDWEEVDKDGGAGAVSEGTLRERDMLALLRRLPLRDLVARIVLFTHSDIRCARDWSWGDARGGRDVLRACCGCRALVHVATRAVIAHAHYARLRRALRALALSAMDALSALHQHAKSSYTKDMELQIQAELEAVFAGGLGLLEPAEFHLIPAALLSYHAARDYCIGHIVNLHDPSVTRVESLSVDLPAMSCDVRVRIVAQAAARRVDDHELARIVLEFLFTIGVKRNVGACTGACRQAARDALPLLLRAHARLYAAALLLVADTSPVEKLDASCISCLSVRGWRPPAAEMRAVAEDWARRCPHLLPPLLLDLDYTPHTGLSLETQLTIGSWLSSQVAPKSPSEVEEWCWNVLCKLRVHRTCWGLPPDAPPPDPEPNSLFAKALALMASSWGHCVPMICSLGVAALCSLAAARVSLALHCLAPIMLLLAPAHESISLTPGFSEFFATVVNASPSLMQRALGRGGVTGADLLMKLVLEQLAEEQCGGVSRSTLVRGWIAALWRPALPATAALLDGALAALHHQPLDEHAATMANAQDEETIQQLSLATRLAAQAPLLCCSALGACHAQRELLPGLYPRLLDALHAQRLTGQRIHVDNALKLIGARSSAEELVIYRCASAVLLAPLQHPAHLRLWALLMQLYLQRPPVDMRNTTPPVGPLFFSGFTKSRTLAQLKRHLQVSINYHHTEASTLTEAAKRASKPNPSTSRVVTSESRTSDNNILSMLSINDLIGESSDSSGTDSDLSEGEEYIRIEEPVKERRESESSSREVKDSANLIAYHVGAVKMLCAYAQWLDEAERAAAAPHHADVARFITESAQAAAWQQYAQSRRPACNLAIEPFPLPPALPPAAPPTPASPFQQAQATLLAIRHRVRKRSRRLLVKSLVEDVNFKDSRSLLTLVDKHLKDIERLSTEWWSERCRVSSLDEALWRLVGELRVNRQLPTMKASCKNKCGKPLRYTHPDQEWCISLSAQTGIKENRGAALASTRRLARPRPHAARTAAALLTIARRVVGGPSALQVLERAWRTAAVVTTLCAPAALAISSFFNLLAERWVSQDGVVCAELVSRWCSRPLSELQHALCPALLAPAALPPPQLPALHNALLHNALPPNVAFSCLSKFDLSRWASSADSAARLQMLAALREAVVRWSELDKPDSELQMVIELVCVQSTSVCACSELNAHVRAWAALAARGAVAPQHLAHLTNAAMRCAPHASMDQLGHLLRELGVIWWEARTGLAGKKHARFAAYAPHVASLLQTLHRSFVAAAVQLSYAPERVALYAWSSLVESWGAWVVPHAATPLLPSVAEHEAYTPMLQQFHQAIQQVIQDCPGTEEHLLNQMFEWVVQTYLSVNSATGNQQSRVQLSALLAELAAAAWAPCQWLRGNTLNSLLQVCQHGDKEMCAWAASCCSGQNMSSWLRGAEAEALPGRLSLLLYLFTCAPLQLPEHILEEATTLPWQRLPEAALEEALDRFFMEHHGLAVPFHELPQFRVILAASEFMWSPHSSVSLLQGSRSKRARLVSQWLRAASVPSLVQHVPAYQPYVLHTIDNIAPHLENSEGEIEDLLSRAMVIMCIEPAAAAALPVWVSWVSAAGRRTLAGCVRASASLTAFQYFAPLADAAVRAYLASNECGGWSDIRALWASCPWRDCAPLCARARLHAAAACLYTHQQSFAAVKGALLALITADIDFVENETICAVWICAATRLALRCGFEGEEGECRAAAAALITRWGEPARRSLLKLVTMQGDTDRPTPRHRVLCLFAQCVLSNSEESNARAFEAAYNALQTTSAASSAVSSAWGRAAHPKRLARLALRLFPGAERHFQLELHLAPDDPDSPSPQQT